MLKSALCRIYSALQKLKSELRAESKQTVVASLHGSAASSSSSASSSVAAAATAGSCDPDPEPAVILLQLHDELILEVDCKHFDRVAQIVTMSMEVLYPTLELAAVACCVIQSFSLIIYV
jgi:DNA polymerase I-like protein with 3'-5' exonuclease and polymerase domains